MPVAMGIDLGTSFFKVALTSTDGQSHGLARRPVPLEHPMPSRSELPIHMFRDTLVQSINRALADGNMSPSEIASISYSSQANTFALFDTNIRPLSPFVVWNDERIRDGTVDVPLFSEIPDFLETTGLGVFNEQMCLAKLAWFRHSMTETWHKTRYVLTISDYLTYLLTGLIAGDSSTASLIGVWNVVESHYEPQLLDAAELDQHFLPELHRPGTPIGRAEGDLPRRIGIPRTATVVAGCLDHVAAAIGAGISRFADASESTGTVLAALGISQRFEPEHGTVVGPYVIPGVYYKLSFSDKGASILEWYRDNFASNLSLDELIKLSATVPCGCDGLFAMSDPRRFPQLDGFRSPNGFAAHFGHGHYVRAIMENVAASLRELLLTIFPETLPKAVVATGGGARSDCWLQIKADIVGTEFIQTGTDEPAAMGATILAAIGAGWFQFPADTNNPWLRTVARYTPGHARKTFYNRWLEDYYAHER